MIVLLVQVLQVINTFNAAMSFFGNCTKKDYYWWHPVYLCNRNDNALKHFETPPKIIGNTKERDNVQ